MVMVMKGMVNGDGYGDGDGDGGYGKLWMVMVMQWITTILIMVVIEKIILMILLVNGGHIGKVHDWILKAIFVMLLEYGLNKFHQKLRIIHFCVFASLRISG